MKWVNPLPDDKVLDWSKFKDAADDNFKRINVYTVWSFLKLSEGLKEALRSSFDKVDKRHTGWLDMYGVREVLQLIGQNPTIDDMKSYFPEGIKRIDRDSIAEFVESNVPLKSKATINDEIADAFSKFNRDENDIVSVVEFKMILTKLGHEPLTDKEADIVIKSLDKKTYERLNVSDLSKLLAD